MIGAQARVYEGMIVGEHSRDNDLVVNVVQGKKLTNVRASGKDEALTLVPPMRLTLEKAMSYITDEELVEITPESIRLRKRWLDPNERKRQERKRESNATPAPLKSRAITTLRLTQPGKKSRVVLRLGNGPSLR